MAVKMNKTYCGDGYPNLPDFNDLGGGDYTAGDGIAISDAGAISASLGDGLTVNAGKKIIPDVDGTTIGVNETSKKLECLVSGAFDYSTEEFDTGMLWVDGSKVYGKVVQSSSLSTGQNTIAHGITDLAHMVQVCGSVSTVSSGDLPIPVVDSAAANMVGVQAINATNIVLYIGSNYAGTYAPASANIVVLYTKAAPTS